MNKRLCIVLIILCITILVNAQHITKIEYFFDTDPGFGNAIPVTISANPDIANLNVSASTNNLSSGIHQLFVRSQDANGKWSITNSLYFYKQIPSNPSLPAITKIEYFFDTDPGFGNATPLTIFANTDIVNLNVSASTSNLNSGIHQLFIRSQDANGKWSITNSLYFYKQIPSNPSLPAITKIEYFFDTDPGFGNAIPLTISANTDIANLNVSASTSNLNSGIHQLFLRSQDANGKWSVTNNLYFYKHSSSTSTFPNITKVEFYFDVDPGFGNGNIVNLTPNTDYTNVNIGASTIYLTPGFHTLFVRSKDDAENWSITNSLQLYKLQNSAETTSTITQLEYFIDTDPGFGNGTNVVITPDSVISGFNFSVDLTNLSGGLHEFYVRSKDANGRWSVTNQRYFYRLANNATPLSSIVSVEYFIDNDPGFGNGINVPFSPSTTIMNLNFDADISALNSGLHQVFVRSKDTTGNWSVTNMSTIDVFHPINLNLFLQGFFTWNSTMANVFYNAGIESIESNKVDSIVVELHEATSPFSLVSSYTGILQSNGVLKAGYSGITSGNSYYIVIRHRNSIETWSANPVLISPQTFYDFTTAATQAYGDNQVEVEQGVFALYTGDINQDGFVDSFDFPALDTDIFNGVSGVYVNTDLNGDGFVDSFDFPLFDVNSFNGVTVMTP